MLKVNFEVNDAEEIARLHEMSPDRFMRFWAVAIRELAKTSAQNAAKAANGRSFWQKEILPSVREEVTGDQATVYSDSPIAAHVHTGGVIRPSQRKYLAIPLDNKAKNKSPTDLPWHTKDGEPVFLPRKRGPGWVLFDAVGRKRQGLKPLFALVPETAPQKPRPWWPDDAAMMAETERFFREDLDEI